MFLPSTSDEEEEETRHTRRTAATIPPTMSFTLSSVWIYAKNREPEKKKARKEGKNKTKEGMT
jgi:hypothetical protein